MKRGGRVARMRLRGHPPWPDQWKPRGFSTLHPEPSAEWWPRVSSDLGHLDPRVAEQWVHRHWSLSEYFGFELADVRSEVRRMPTATILSEVGMVDDFRPEDREDDFEEVIRRFNPPGEPFEPAKTMNATGSWNMPILLFQNAGGFAYDDRRTSDAHLWLLEGHLRMRYLRALVNTGRSVAAEHEVLVLTRPDKHRK